MQFIVQPNTPLLHTVSQQNPKGGKWEITLVHFICIVALRTLCTLTNYGLVQNFRTDSHDWSLIKNEKSNYDSFVLNHENMLF